VCGAENLNFLLPENKIEKIYLNFSCPYPKKTYHNRRLTNPRFLNLYRSLLTDGGYIIQKTDNRPFFDYSVESFSSSGYEIDEITYDLYSSEYINDNIATEYEKKFVAEGKPICRLKATPKKI
ncbi:MAG: tRNA (guanosine(46)-N7)-methyltransferase TrmB, partial [Clostridia bacterium]|nr:tRNA (guanosine(46)-N7)-methyltransferase TrmB [Clostridia bacterium]